MPTSTSKSRKSVIRPVELKSEVSEALKSKEPQQLQGVEDEGATKSCAKEASSSEPAKTRKKAAVSSAKSKTELVPPIELKISHESIANRAWEIWQSQGCPSGRELENWLQAEKELTSSN